MALGVERMDSDRGCQKQHEPSHGLIHVHDHLASLADRSHPQARSLAAEWILAASFVRAQALNRFELREAHVSPWRRQRTRQSDSKMSRTLSGRDQHAARASTVSSLGRWNRCMRRELLEPIDGGSKNGRGIQRRLLPRSRPVVGVRSAARQRRFLEKSS
jgi:hypothetical protein